MQVTRVFDWKSASNRLDSSLFKKIATGFRIFSSASHCSTVQVVFCINSFLHVIRFFQRGAHICPNSFPFSKKFSNRDENCWTYAAHEGRSIELHRSFPSWWISLCNIWRYRTDRMILWLLRNSVHLRPRKRHGTFGLTWGHLGAFAVDGYNFFPLTGIIHWGEQYKETYLW